MNSTELLNKPGEIIEQVSRILDSSMFKKSKILSNFLHYISFETIQGNQETLKEYVIATNVLKKKTDFNPQLDGIVRIHANRLRKLLKNYYENEGIDDPIYVSVPKGRYIPSFNRNNQSQLPAPTIQDQFNDKIEAKPVIAVLPFKNIQKNERIAVMCSILCQDLSIELTRFPEIGVISNYSAEYAAEHISEMKDIISNLGVDYLITGSCFAEGKSIKVNIELNACHDNKLLWADSYYIEDFEKDSLNCYKEVIQKVTAMTCGFFGLIYRNTLNAHIPNDYDQLYAVYWHNRYHRLFTEESFHETLKAVDVGLKKNPQNAMLMAFKGELFLNLIAMDVQGDIDFLKSGTELVQNAIKFDPNCQHAYQVYAWSNLLNHNKKELYHSINSCLKINPNNPMYTGQMGFGYICAGDYDKGLDLMSESIELNPYYTWNLNIGFSFYFIHTGEYEEALHWAELINRRSLIWDPLLRTAILGLLERKEEAIETHKELALLSPNFSERAIAIVNAFLFDKKLKNRILQGLRRAGVHIKN